MVHQNQKLNGLFLLLQNINEEEIDFIFIFRYKGTKELSDGVKYNITREGDKCILTINNATPDDVDEYSIKARNPAGSRMCRCDVKVRCKFIIKKIHMKI